MQVAQPLAALGVCQGEALPDSIAHLLEATDFQGKSGQMRLLYTPGVLPARRLLLLGLGERAKLTPDTLRQAGARAARQAHELQLDEFGIGMTDLAPLAPAEAAEALAEGIELGLYRYMEQKSHVEPEQTHQIKRVSMALAGASAESVRRGQVIALGVMRARDLANAPGNVMTPTRMGELAREIGAQSDLTVTVLGREELQQQGFGGLLAVAQGSAQPPAFIIMEHGTAAASRPTICLVGKGVTFDTGGISIKPREHMDAMKMDMGGAAAVLGVMQVVGELQLPLHVVALIGAAENMPGALAYKPGDVITTLSGKTVEVLNTDAEGRIVLADALWYARRYQPEAMIDIATLTGAIDIALGPHAIGLMGTDSALLARIVDAGEASKERVWQLPLWDEYRDMIKSTVADIRNTGGGRRGGAITAAAFLDAFVDDIPWAHLDIAATVGNDSPSRPDNTPGATGVGVRLLAKLLLSWDDAIDKHS